MLYPKTYRYFGRQYIQKTHYEPQIKKLEEAEVPSELLENPVFRELVWSASVQHGGNTGVITNALQQLSDQGVEITPENLKQIIDQTMEVRSGDFPSSTPQVQEAVKNRFVKEGQDLKNLI